ncbi:hypothetical protein D3C71_1980500 [compost metagenome]
MLKHVADFIPVIERIVIAFLNILLGKILIHIKQVLDLLRCIFIQLVGHIPVLLKLLHMQYVEQQYGIIGYRSTS